MKYAFVALALAATAHAQSRDDIPKCAIDCLDKGIESETSCSTTDYTCVCKNFSKVQAVSTSCVIDACGADVAVNDVLPAVQALCEAIESGGGETTAKETTAKETTAEETSAAAETTSAAAETTSAAAETTSAAAETTSAAAEETTSEAEEETTTAAAPTTAAPNATTPGTSEPTTTVITGAAAAIGSIGGLAMLVLAAIAL